MKIVVLVIPADETKPMRIEEIRRGHLSAMQGIVGGYLEAVDLFHPDGSMYLNEEGKICGLPINVRATHLLWAHNRAFEGQDVICGDVFITGGVDEDGNDLRVNAIYVGDLG